jgi:hypothetical protein
MTRTQSSRCTIFHPLGAALLALFVLGAVQGCAARQSTADSADSAEPDDYYVSPDEDSETPAEGSDGSSDDEAERDEATGHVLVRRAPTSSGALDGEAAGRVLYDATAELERCYVDSGGAELGEGVVFALLDVEADGAVSDVLIGHSDVKAREFVDCIGMIMSHLGMPTSTGTSVLQAYLVFGAGSEEQGRQMMRAYREARSSSTEPEPSSFTEVRRSVQGCYERIFRGTGREVGRLVLDLTVVADGRVENVEIAEENLSGRLDECVVAAVLNLRLDVEQEGESNVLYPVVIYPGR